MDPNKDYFDLDDAELFANGYAGWVVITSHAQHYIGCLSDRSTQWGERTYEDDLHAIKDFMPVMLLPAFEFIPMTIQVPQQGPGGRVMPGVARQPFITTPHFTVEPVALHVQPTAYYLFADMKESDQELYKGLVKSAISHAKRERAARSNIVMPTERERGVLVKGPNGA